MEPGLTPLEAHTDSAEIVSRALALCAAIVDTDASDLNGLETYFAELDPLIADQPDSVIETILAADTFKALKNRLHAIRADYEYDRELALADDIIAEDSAAVAEDFRSHDWYDKALDFETNALASYSLKSILFVGSGPFPTSPLAFQRNNPAARVTCMEREAAACARAAKVAAIYGFPDLDIRNVDGAEAIDFSEFDCVIVGLVVGAVDEDKATVVRHFLKHVPTTCLLCFRTATGSGRVVYPTVSKSELEHRPHEILQGPPHKSFTLILLPPGENQDG